MLNPESTWTTSAELELVRPDDDMRGSLWPWALAALTWRPRQVWEVASAVEASASAEYDKADASALAEYKKAVASARAEYEKARASAFAKAYLSM